MVRGIDTHCPKCRIPMRTCVVGRLCWECSGLKAHFLEVLREYHPVVIQKEEVNREQEHHQCS